MSSLSVSIGVFQIVVQFVAAYISYRIYAFNRVRKGWLMVTIALLLMAARRITALSLDLGWLSALPGDLQFIDRFLLPALISIFLLAGLWTMKRNFDRLDVVEKQVKKKVKRINEVIRNA